MGWGTHTLRTNAISFNTAARYGGGVEGGGTMEGNRIISNHAGQSGGGIYSSQASLMTNNLVAGNSAGRSGSGLYLAGDGYNLLHNTIARNTGGDGSGITVASYLNTVSLTNTILVSHTVGITLGATNIAHAEATLWGIGPWSNGTDWAGDGDMHIGTINIWDEPGFVDPDTGDYHLGPGSGALGLGVDAGVTQDMDNDPRPNNPDLGADEYWEPGTFSYIYNPLVARDYAFCHDFYDDFSNSASGWEIGENDHVRTEYLNGEYRILTKASGYIYLFTAPTCKHQDYEVEVDARWVGTPGSSYGIFFGNAGGFQQYFLFDMNTDFQQFRLYRRDSAGWHLIMPITFSPAINKDNTTNHIKAIRQGRWMTLEVNGTTVGSWVDDTISGVTSVGIISSPYLNAPSSDARFDNFHVTALPSLTATALEAQTRGAWRSNTESKAIRHEMMLWSVDR